MQQMFSWQLFFHGKGITEEEAFVLFVRKNALQVLIPKYGLEGTVFMDKQSQSGVTFNEEVSATWVSKVIRICFGTALLRSLIGLKTHATFSANQKWNQNQSWLARASFPALRVIASSFDWTVDCPASFVIGQSNYFGFGLTTLSWNLL